MVEKPVGVRYAWGSSPVGNLKVNGKPWLPLHNFRTDSWDFPESEDPAVSAMTRPESRARAVERAERLAARRQKEAEMAKEILERLKTLPAQIEKKEE